MYKENTKLINKSSNLLNIEDITGKMRPTTPNKRKKTVEERYQKKTQIEHILLRPDTYIGSTEYHEQSLWVWDDYNKRMVYKTINYVPGLYKIFDEILVNAADVKAREISNKNIERCTCIKVDINTIKREITVYNDGEGIPIEIHKEHQVYVPELIFGHLLTSDNYDDNEDRVTGGRNGFGAKLTNIFSKEFNVECGDSSTERVFKMTWLDNMSKKSDEILKENYKGKSYVKITFKPDLERFGGMKEFDDDILSLLHKRVYDISGTTSVKVYLNGNLIPIKDFKSYTLLYLRSRISGNILESNDNNDNDENNNDNIEKKTRPSRNTGKKNNVYNELDGYNDKYDDEYDEFNNNDEDDDWDTENLSSKQGKKNLKSKKKKANKNNNSNLSSSSIVVSGGSNDNNSPLIIYESAAPKWEVVISESDGQFQHVSFVNSICTIKGGTHISYILDPLINAILKRVQTKNKGGIDIKNHHIKSHIWIFVKCLIVNPSFDSQTKETLTTKISKYGSTFALSDKTINSVIKSSIIENVLMWAQMKQNMELKRKMKSGQKNTITSRLLGIPKLEDANEAGGPNSKKCTLILTEGDSAKTSCLAGLSIVGRDYFGVFPLRGKLLNVREASFKQQVNNLEIQNILKILGLGIGQKYENGPVNLRYGSLMLMTDQDHDGSHIKGLIINLIHYYWPSLVHYRGFLKQFVTPIVKAKKNNTELSFFTLYEYELWRKNNAGNLSGWKFKYYKGLGTSTDIEFKEYFTNIENHSIEFFWNNEDDDEAIDMAFSKKRTEDRKQWIESYKDGNYIDYSVNNQCRNLRYYDFINKELVLFSRYDTVRSIPNLLDGLKPGQRKVLFAAFKKKLNNELKVAQFAGYVAEHSAYHHGESSLQSTIVNMAQNFVGSNNLNLLQPCGQFGSRKEGGKDASAARYIFTKLSKWTRYIFPEADDPLLNYLYDDGQQIEPLYYVPIIPMILVNGTDGIGTGWSSSVPNYNPKDIIMNLKRVLRGEIMVPMTPWYKSFKGKVVPIKQKNSKKNSSNINNRKNNVNVSKSNVDNSQSSDIDMEDENTQNNNGNNSAENSNLELGANYETYGNWYKKDDETLVITELPVRKWTQDYKEWLESTLIPPPNTDADDIDNYWVIDYRDNSSHENVNIKLRLRPEKLLQVENEGIEKVLKLKSTLSTSNMTLFDHNSRIVRYETELDILKEFIPIRLEMYNKRKKYLLSKLNYDKYILEQKILFLKLVIGDKIKLSNKNKESLVLELKKNNVKSINEIKSVTNWDDLKKNEDYELNYNEYSDSEGMMSYIKGEDDEIKLYDYLLSMPLWNLTIEKMEILENELVRKTSEYNKLMSTSIEEIWNNELDELLNVIEEEETREEIVEAEHKSLLEKRRLSVDWNVNNNRKNNTKRKNNRQSDSSGSITSKKLQQNNKKITKQDKKKNKKSSSESELEDDAELDDIYDYGEDDYDCIESEDVESNYGDYNESIKLNNIKNKKSKPESSSRKATHCNSNASKSKPKTLTSLKKQVEQKSRLKKVRNNSQENETNLSNGFGDNNNKINSESDQSKIIKPLESTSLLQRLQQRADLVNYLNKTTTKTSSYSTQEKSSSLIQTKIPDLFKSKESNNITNNNSSVANINENCTSSSSKVSLFNGSNGAEQTNTTRISRRKRPLILSDDGEDDDNEKDEIEDEFQESENSVSSDSMSRGNQRDIDRQRAQKRQDRTAPKTGKSTIEQKDKILSIVCNICKQSFMCTANKQTLEVHVETRHPKLDYSQCFPNN
ncbi:DNA topoisomerase II [Cryptosporidium xiaoi]|uniref:DNA topoisomerase 2 n=1 Tax=Cryptosporidium xiaoi TaxID=659607 RepID=A0AAV9XU37_9CRYT